MKQVSDPPIVIEGLGGAGKTTAAQNLAIRYGYHNFNTGSLFRATAAAMLLQRVGLFDLAGFVQEAKFDVDLSDPLHPLIAVSDKEVSHILQTPRVTRLSAYIGTQPLVQEQLESTFDTYLSGTKMVVEGKHIGDRIPTAPGYHFFLIATKEVRAFRKWNQARLAGYKDYSIYKARSDILANDWRDRQLLKVEAGTHVIDTTTLKPLQVVEAIKQHINRAAQVL